MILEVVELSKSFGHKEVLKNISFSIGQGEIAGLVGPNGSGKTTMLNIITGMIKMNSGTFYLKEGTKVGMSISRKGFFNDMSVYENIMMYSKLMDARKEEVMQKMELFMIDYGKMRFGQLSAGMKQRVSLLLAFLGRKDLIILDEPSNHLDVDSIFLLRSIILKLKAENVSFLVTSHIFSDLEKVCDRMLFMKDGYIVTNASTSSLIQEHGDLEKAYLHVSSPTKLQVS